MARAAPGVLSGPRSGAAARGGGCVPGGRAAYDVLAAGCVRAPGLVRVRRQSLARIPLRQCQDYCTLEAACVLAEVSGCRDNPAHCGGSCTLGYVAAGAAPDVSVAGDCGGRGDRRVSVKRGPRPWLFRNASRYYINLPRDNWSASKFEGRPALVTVWDKLRIQGTPARGATSVLVDVLDESYSHNNGRRLAYKWGLAVGCAALGAFRISLAGTPFRLQGHQPLVRDAVAWGAFGVRGLGGAANCSHGQTACAGACGGQAIMSCGECVLGPDFSYRLVTLEVGDRGFFDAAFPADCGPPAHPSDPHVSYGRCDTTSSGRCAPRCTARYAGDLAAVCGSDGGWAYRGRCREAQAFTMGFNLFGQLGVVGEEDQSAPQPLLAPNEAPISAIAVGERHTAFIAGGVPYVLGSNDKGQLGLSVGAGPGRHAAPRRVALPRPNPVVAAAAGLAQTGFVPQDGTAYVMGDNQVGQLGLGKGATALTPARLHSDGAPVTALAMGAFHTAILTRGRPAALLRAMCARGCRGHGHCCHDVATSANKTVSCVQACMVRQQGAGLSECRAQVAAVEATDRPQLEVGRLAESVCEGCEVQPGGVHNRSGGWIGCSIEVHDCPRLRVSVPEGRTGCKGGVYVPSPGHDMEEHLVYIKHRSLEEHAFGTPLYLYWSARYGGDDLQPETIFGYIPGPGGEGHWWYAGQWHTHPSRVDCQQEDCFMMGYAAHGQLGDTFLSAEPRWTPLRLISPNHEPISALALGERHSMFLAGGECFVMGSNEHGQLGLGKVFERTQAPVKLQAPNGWPITAIAAGR